MENWSYRIREFWLLNHREIKRYGLCVWMVFVGLLQSVHPLAWFGLGAGIVMWAFDRWGRPYAELGKQKLSERPPKK
jgi:hypothetical protein